LNLIPYVAKLICFAITLLTWQKSIYSFLC